MKAKAAASEKAKKQRRRTIIYIYMLLILLSLFVGVSYTWFTLSRSPRVSDMNVYITTQPGLELSADMENWDLQLDFWDIINVTDPLDEEKDKPVLRPVTWSEEQQCFVAAAYGADGRLLAYRDWHNLSDERNANKQNFEGYYVKATFYVRCGQNADISLSPAVEVNEGIDGSGTYVRGVPVWNPGYPKPKDESSGESSEGSSSEESSSSGESSSETSSGDGSLSLSEVSSESSPESESSEGGGGLELEEWVGMGHDNGGLGAEGAIRFGFRITNLKQNEEGQFVPDEENEPFFMIYEPNCDAHVNGAEGYFRTPSMDGTEDLIDPEKIILQSKSFWEESDPIEHGVVIHTLGDFVDAEGTVIDPPKLFSIKTGEIVKIELYVWLEGQDMDCVNMNSEAMIEASIQFAGKGEGNSGLVKIE
ncbi:MAG: hypothetical protein IJO22_07130 [Oscillospiraceae bacterium]|nr:hypothetical protein [Oscillospiraceae bacterium]